MTRIESVTVPFATFVRQSATYRLVIDDTTGRQVGVVDAIRGFSHFTGTGPFAGTAAVIRGDAERLREALREGVKNGRDDRA